MSDLTRDAVLLSAARRLKKAGIENSAQEARWLLEHVCGGLETALSQNQLTHFEALLTRRLNREPLQHILGSATFYVLDLKSDQRALIPREDSYTVVDLALSHLAEGRCWIADLGTGSGVLLCGLMAARTDIIGIAVEHSAQALSLAQENFTALDLSDRITTFQGSWTDWTGWCDCDLIISNPPYIRSDIIPMLDPEVKDYEPHEALDGGPDGLQAYREIISLGAAHMKSRAHLVLEIGFDQKQAVSQLLQTHGFTHLTHKKDLGGRDRAIAARKP